ncbi:MAG TPA: IS21 family transposase [Chloroflexota bacterium]|nr:IS21 family transposase [Chloroflexota bacterium]
MERSSIQLLHKRGKSQREIARELGRSRVTVARALREPADRAPAQRDRPSIVDTYREDIGRWLEEGLTAARMLELARGDPDKPYPGGHSVFRAAVRRERLRGAQAVADVPVRFEGLPGEYLQVDWGEIRRFPFTQAPPRTRYFLACRLKYSRWVWVWFASNMRQENLLRGLIACFRALGFVPWVLVFDNMKTVTSGRDPQRRPIWTPALLQLASEFGFHPEACTPGAANQKGAVESLVKWVKGNFLSGRDFADDTDLAQQATAWQAQANARPSSATGRPPNDLLAEEVAKGGELPARAHDYGFLYPGRVNRESLVAVLGNQYSVPVNQVNAPVTVRVHPERIVIWRDNTLLARHDRAPNGARRRVVTPEHFAPLFGRKPRAQVMLYREALLDLGELAQRYVSELSRRKCDRLRQEVLSLYALLQAYGADALQAAMAAAERIPAYGAEYVSALLCQPAPRRASQRGSLSLVLKGVPDQAEIDRQLSLYEAYVHKEPVAAGAER